VGVLNMMIAIPFGSSYFPVGWRASTTADNDDGNDNNDGVDGPFPLPGKQALGTRGESQKKRGREEPIGCCLLCVLDSL
jgi:hypothetical protein